MFFAVASLMSAELQTVLALGIVALTVALLVRSAFRKKRAGNGCASGGCGCPTADFKAKLKRL
jgi:hypothetical protein